MDIPSSVVLYKIQDTLDTQPETPSKTKQKKKKTMPTILELNVASLTDINLHLKISQRGSKEDIYFLALETLELYALAESKAYRV